MIWVFPHSAGVTDGKYARQNEILNILTSRKHKSSFLAVWNGKYEFLMYSYPEILSSFDMISYLLFAKDTVRLKRHYKAI